MRPRELAAWCQATFGVKVQRACHLAQFSRTSWYRRSTAKDQRPLRLRIRELAHARPRFGAERIWVLLRREGWLVNRKRVRRPYRLCHAGAKCSSSFRVTMSSDVGRPLSSLVENWSPQTSRE